MTSTTEKIKQVLHLDKNSTTTHSSNVPEGTAGPHNSRVANAADPRIDSDMDGSNRHAAHTGTTGGAFGTGSGVTGHSTTGTGAGYNSSTTAGPHTSNLANKMDPTVDSDLDGGRHLGAKSDARTAGYTGTGVTGTTHAGTHTGTHTGAHTGTTGGYSSNTTAGPHSSNLANKVDPRVDSDLSGSHTAGGAGYGSTHTGTSHSTTGAGYGTTHPATTTGPHSSNIANKIDPRVDSTTGHSTNGHSTYSQTHPGTAGNISHSTNAGPHNSNLVNKADPRVDSDRDGRGVVQHAVGGNGTHATPGSGTAQNTAGPHNSDLLNKLDPVRIHDLNVFDKC
jgi:hypothetical protein